MIKGIDGSHWKQSIDADVVKAAGYQFVWWKTTEGMGSTDATYAAARASCKAAGLAFGGFHLGRNDGSGAAQWARFKSLARLTPGEPVGLDIEAGPSISDVNAWGWIKAALADGHPPVVYGLPNDVHGFSSKAGVYTWQVGWTSQRVIAPCLFTQLTAAHVPGIGSNPTDIDTFNGTAAQLAAFFGQAQGGDDEVDQSQVDYDTGYRMRMFTYQGSLPDAPPGIPGPYTKPDLASNPNKWLGWMDAERDLTTVGPVGPQGPVGPAGPTGPKGNSAVIAPGATLRVEGP